VPDLADLSTAAVYAFLAALVFAESGILLGFFLPGDTVLFAAGLLSGDPDTHLSLPLLIAVVLVAAVSGDAVGYWLGARAGLPLLQGREGRVLNAANLARAERFYERYGVLAVVVARWIPWIRTVTPVLAGIAGMPYRRFLPANVVGAVLWGAGLLTLGHLAASTPALKHSAVAVAVAVVAASVVAGLVRVRLARSRG
jgi:membrane-associated protein